MGFGPAAQDHPERNMGVPTAPLGIIAKPLTLQDAPTSFGAVTEEHFLHQFIMAMERWVPEVDRETDHLAKIMASPELQAQINDRRLKPESNAVAIGNAGHVEIENIHYSPQFMNQDSATRHYLVRFQRTVWRGSNKESTEPWTATVDFQWHPERAMTPADRADNPAGFVAIAYTSDSDNKDTRRK
jgi:type IV secretory pathway component VirB8